VPVVSNQAYNTLGIFPPVFEQQAHDLVESFDGRPEFVGSVILDHVPKFFDGIELRTVRRQHEDMDAIGNLFMAAVLGVETGAIPYHHVLITWILQFYLFKEGFGPIQINRGRLHKHGFALNDV
tara:strand:+ start:152 stop:523 length:372 start_codon:yes stop_codon:yes gene_type:complete